MRRKGEPLTRFHGVIVPTATLFHEDGSVDWDANERLVDRLIAAGVHGLFALGSTGEAQHLTVEERTEIIRWSARFVRGRVPLLVGVGDTSTATAVALTREAERAGADGVVAIGPYYWVFSERHLYAYFTAIAGATALPTLLYNYPHHVGVNLSPEFIARLADDRPNILGVKDTLDSATHMRRLVHHVKQGRDGFSVLSGHDDLSLFALNAGLDGFVTSTANFAPELLVQLWNAWHDGAHALARGTMTILSGLLDAYALDPCGAAVVKAALSLRGWIPCDRPRPPALPLTPESRTELRRIMGEAGLLEGRAPDEGVAAPNVPIPARTVEAAR